MLNSTVPLRRVILLCVGLGCLGAGWLWFEHYGRGARGDEFVPSVHHSTSASEPRELSTGDGAQVERAPENAARRAEPTEPAGAAIDLQVTGVPQQAQGLEVIWVRPSPVEGGFARASEPIALIATGGAAKTRIEVPAGVPLHFVLTAPGLLVSTADRPLVLEVGERREFAIDLGTACAVEGRVLDVPDPVGVPLALTWCTLARGQQDPLFPGSTSTARVLAGPDGSFRFLGLPGASCSLDLQTALGPIALAERASGRTTWSACQGGLIEVTPAEALVGIAPIAPTGERLADEPFSVLLDGSAHFQPRPYPGGMALVRLRQVAESDAVGLFLPRRGWFLFERSELDLRAGNVVELAVPDGAVSGGDVRIRTGAPIPDGLSVDFLSLTTSGPRALVPSGTTYAEEESTWPIVERLSDGVRLRALPPGTYELAWVWRHGGRRVLASPVEVVEGAERLVTCVPPALRSIRGRVDRWDEIPADLRPVHIWIEGAGTIVADGSFSLPVLEPAPDRARVRGPASTLWRSPLPLRSERDGELVLEFPFELLERVPLDVPPCRGGRIVAEVDQSWQDALPDSVLVPRAFVQPAADGRPVIVFESGTTCTGWVIESSAGSKIFRGWFSLGPGTSQGSASFAGRPVSLVFDEPDRIVDVELEGPDGSGAPVHVATFDSSRGATPLWIPDGAVALRVRARGNAARRIPLDSDSQTVEVSLH